MPHVPSGYANICHRLSLAGDPEEMCVTMGVKIDASELTQMEDVANDLFQAWRDAFVLWTSNQYSFLGVELEFNDDGNKLEIDSTSAAVLGGMAAGPLPNNCARLIQKRTALGGRAHRGRCYMPGSAEGDADALGAIPAPQLAEQSVAVAQWLTDINSVTGVDFAVVLHATDVLPPTRITSLQLDRRIATQRRRLR